MEDGEVPGVVSGVEIEEDGKVGEMGDDAEEAELRRRNGNLMLGRR